MKAYAKHRVWTMLVLSIAIVTPIACNKPTVDNEQVPYKLVIIGSGPAGLTAGIHASRVNLKPLIIEGKTPGGSLIYTESITNWPGEQHISGADLMEKIRDHAQECGSAFLEEEIAKIDLTKRPFSLWTNQDKHIQAHSIIITTGNTPKTIGCPGEKDLFGKGVATCSTCDGPLYTDKKVVIIGSGTSAAYEALAMSKYTQKITIITDQDSLKIPVELQKKLDKRPYITIIPSLHTNKIEGDGSGVTGVRVTNLNTKQQLHIPADGVFIALGLIPCTHIFKGQLDIDPKGYIKVTDNTKTSVEGVFAAGTVCDSRYKTAITAAGYGCMAAIDAERYLNKILELKKS